MICWDTAHSALGAGTRWVHTPLQGSMSLHTAVSLIARGRLEQFWYLSTAVSR